MSAVRRVLAGLLIASLAAAAPALAAGKSRLPPGVHGAPGSPAGQEYVIPLAQARNTAGGSGARPFGQGVTPARGSGATASTSATRSASAAGSRAGSAKPRGAAKRRQRRRSQPAQAARFGKPLRISAAGGIGLAWMGGAALLVLALGGFAGYRLRRSSR